jgi:hypothetical protein
MRFVGICYRKTCLVFISVFMTRPERKTNNNSNREGFEPLLIANETIRGDCGGFEAMTL